MVALFVAGTFLLCVIVDYFVAQPHTTPLRKDVCEGLRRKDEREGVRLVLGLGPCMADGSDKIKKETK